MKLRRESNDVYYLADSPPRLRLFDLRALLAKARQSRRKRARFCLHSRLQDRVHEMVVAVQSGSYIAPHKHRTKVESYHVIQGRADLILFDHSGGLEKVIPMGPPSSGLSFVCRVPQNQYHSFLLRTESFIFHEVTRGPFHRAETLRAPWSPDETDGRMARAYMKTLVDRVSRVKRRHA